MRLDYTDEDKAFREEVRSFLAEKLPSHISKAVKAGRMPAREDYITWQRILNEKGWAVHSWPKEHGGSGFTPFQKHIFEEECVKAGAPELPPFGLNMLGPVLIAFGSEEQKAHYLPRILNCDDWWCQGYSEPGAGSDLASLKTKAVRDGDHYIVNGQKTWTTMGQYADWIFCLVRTSSAGKPQEGISFLLIDMDTPGVEMRPIITIEGGHEVNEVFFQDVKVPVENLVGEENKGWTYAKYLLQHERVGIAGVAAAKEGLKKLKRIAAETDAGDGSTLIEDPAFATRIANVELDLMAMELTNLRVLAQAQAGGAPGAESSMLKIKGSVIRQEISDLLRRAVGPYALPFMPELELPGANEEPIGPDGANAFAGHYFNRRKYSIYGGSNEIQRNIISKMILGL
ncbi:acyl-CoA dehydrogenase family protein [Kordiimonas aestuarii]|uniref:acyl-CoA dehydrogenase family protein n=1 Tax=Kordiimonas aestuarii TaxID=1005925 RepID=UPI0021CE37A5|nr:acyl-CoA dehydrogenase family protein [Kordiimonas aestuarii]